MENTKITKKDNFMALRGVVENDNGFFTPEEVERLLAFIDHELELLDKRSASARKYAKKNEKATDELAEACVSALSTEDGAMLTIPQILEKLPAELEATPQKLTYRLNKLVELGTIVKDQVSFKAEGKASRKINCYGIPKVEA